MAVQKVSSRHSCCNMHCLDRVFMEMLGPLEYEMLGSVVIARVNRGVCRDDTNGVKLCEVQAMTLWIRC